MPDLFASALAPMLTLLGYIQWDIDPIIGSVGPLTFRYYGILFASGLLIGHAMFVKEFEREGDDPERAVVLTYWLVAGIVLGARLAHVFFYDPDFYMSHPGEILKFWKGGLASHGASLGVVLVMLAYAKIVRNVPFRLICDRLCVAIPPTMITVRLGNLFNSEVYGSVTDVPWAFVFKRIDDLPRHPSQLYETCTGILILFVMLGVNRYYAKKGTERPLGLTSSLLIGIYFSMRFVVEFFKEYQAESVDAGLTMGQYLSVPFALSAFVGLWLCLKGPWKNQHASQYQEKLDLTPPAEAS